MKKVLTALFALALCPAIWSYDYGIKFLKEEERVTEFPEDADITALNERYDYITTSDEKVYLIDKESHNQALLPTNMYVYSFEITGFTPVMAHTRYETLYLNPDLTGIYLEDKKFYDIGIFYKEAAIVKRSGETHPVLIDIYGNVIREDITHSKTYFYEGVVYCNFSDGSAGFMNNKGEVEISVPKKYIDYSDIVNYYFQDGIVILNCNHKDYMVMNRKGEVLYETSDKLLSNHFIEDKLGFKAKKKDGRYYYGYLDRNFNVVVPANTPTELGYSIPPYSEWLAKHPVHKKIEEVTEQIKSKLRK